MTLQVQEILRRGAMKYIRIQRGNYEPIITIGEYVQATDPKVFTKLIAFAANTKAHDRTELVLTAADVENVDKYYFNIMTERPKPGRGGLLPGEGEEVLYD